MGRDHLGNGPGTAVAHGDQAHDAPYSSQDRLGSWRPPIGVEAVLTSPRGGSEMIPSELTTQQVGRVNRRLKKNGHPLKVCKNKGNVDTVVIARRLVWGIENAQLRCAAFLRELGWKVEEPEG